MRTRTITTQAQVQARARPTHTILVLSLAVALMAAAASTASAHRAAGRSLQPGSVGFGDRQVGTTSPAQALTLNVSCPLSNGCNDRLLTPRISVSGDYAQTNNCPSTLLGAEPWGSPQVSSCTINVTFAPTSTGPASGTLRTGKGTCVTKAHTPRAHEGPCAGPTATLTGNGVTTPTPPTPPLTLDVGVVGEVDGSKTLYATTNHDSRLVVRGREIKKATRQLTGEGGPYPPSAGITLRPKHRVARKVKVKVKATDKFGQTATDELKVGVIRKGFLSKP
jgi:hypothetical protein